MFIRLIDDTHEKIVDISNKCVSIVESESDEEGTLLFGVVVISDPSKFDIQYVKYDEYIGDEYIVLADCETDAGIGSKPILHVLDKICDSIAKGDKLLTLEREFYTIEQIRKKYGIAA